jgi:hypothetical protein
MKSVFDSLQELVKYIRENPNATKSKSPFIVNVFGTEKYALSGNSDQAIARVTRELGVTVKGIPIINLIMEGTNVSAGS